MRNPKKLLNDPNNVRQEVMQGLIYAYQGKLTAISEHCAVYGNHIANDQVVIVSGGGTGHEPTFAGFIGKGGIDGCALGEVFTSPSPDQIIEVTKAIEKGKGVLFLYGNYSGDGMNFDISAEILAEENITIKTIRATDDIASAPLSKLSDRRGVAGLMFLYKIAGAAAQFEKYDLNNLYQVVSKANGNVRTIGVALDGCALPQSSHFNFQLEDNEIEIGIGIHGEAGLRRQVITSSDQVVKEMIDNLCDDLPFKKGDRVCVLINNLGALSNAELYIITRKVGIELGIRGIISHDVVVGHFCTSLEMSGFSISLLKLDEELRHLYDLPCQTLGWRK
ncbi:MULTISPECIES: dihydroxyacetone kinase subunit DhaK [unclassified Gilliamella]|jgi:phosphoenolpyruvate---glycerone phosphotransferase subunit DhaK|uniref:dihydroxyacetone kinase subunit DhaK n=1 Tax=unclassified Gilliamella TaxID=2685620 RepID=UPI00080E3C7D|nr:dihydroxyacetone kinase subunit DhaK [Gilliamella apicola]OCG18037.1 dihydroxyacetone kinase [Gilliamella apicola]OCG56708.1 dihydroxyacetone kinase [Gilliamella apicola]